MYGILLMLQLMGPVLGTSSNASIAIATKPAGATFTVFNLKGQIVRFGKTPYVGMLPSGRYRLVIQKTGYFMEQRGIVVKSGQQRIIQVQMFPQAGKKTSPRPSPRSRAASPQGKPAGRTKPADRVPVAKPRSAPKQRKSPSQSLGAPPPPAANEIPPPDRKTKPQPQGKNSAPSQKKRKPASRVVSPKKKPKKAKRKIPWIPLAAAAGLGIAGGIFWGLSDAALNASRDLNRTQIEAYNEYQQARSHRSTAVFMIAGSGVAIGLAALFYFWPSSSNSKTKPVKDDIPIIGFTLDPFE